MIIWVLCENPVLLKIQMVFRIPQLIPFGCIDIVKPPADHWNRNLGQLMVQHDLPLTVFEAEEEQAAFFLILKAH